MSDSDAHRTMRLALAAAFVLYTASLTATVVSAGDDGARLAVSPKRVPVTSRYHGSAIRVDLVVPSGHDIAVKLEGRRHSVIFNRKGKVLFLWMNVGEVAMGNAPQAYMLYTSRALAELAPAETLQRLTLGLDALGPGIETRGEGIDRETMLREFYDYKRKSGLYRLSYGSLRPERGEPGPNGTDCELYSVSIELPSRIPVGSYEVVLYVLEDGELYERKSETVTIEKTGFPLFVSRLAREHPGEYGLLAIVVAVTAGFFVGLVFSHVGRRG